MGNQLRAAFYLLARNPWAMAAVVVPAVAAALSLAIDAVYLSQGVGVAISLDTTLPLGPSLAQGLSQGMAFLLVMLAVLGLASADLARGGVRMACATDRGRDGFVASRFVRTLGVSVGLGVYILVLRLLSLAIEAFISRSAPRLSFSPDDALRVLDALLLVAAYAEMAQLVCWAVGGGVAQGLVGCFLLGMLEFLAYSLLQGQMLSGRPLSGLFDALSRLLPCSGMQAVVDASAEPTFAWLLVPVLWLVVACALSRWLWARRAV